MSLRRLLPSVLVVAAALSARARAEYPAPWVPPGPQTIEMDWTSGTTANFSFDKIGDIRNGELQYVLIQFSTNDPYYDATIETGQAQQQAGEIAQVIDLYTLSMPSLQIYYDYDPAVFHWSTLGPLDQPVVQYQQRPYLLAAGSAYSPWATPTFDVFHADDYSPPAFLGSASGSLKVTSIPVPELGSVTKWHEHLNMNFSATATFREWKTNEALAQRAKPEPQGNGGMKVSPKPRFNFTSEETAKLSEYDHFNWYQEVVGFRIGVKNGSAGTTLDSTQMQKYVEGQMIARGVPNAKWRGFGPDPLPGGNPGSLGGDAEPLYWDEGIVPGRAAYYWSPHNFGLDFVDYPNMPNAGDQILFMTALAGVKKDGSFDLLFTRDDVPNADDFVFRWAYTQTSDTTGTSFSFDNIDPALGGGGSVAILGTGSGGLSFNYALPGDADHNGTVDFADLLILAKHYNQTGQAYEAGDFTFDGTVNLNDLLILARHYGDIRPAAVDGASAEFNAALAQAFALVPEPGTIGFVVGLIPLLRRRTNRRRSSSVPIGVDR